MCCGTGHVANGLVAHPGGKHVIYPLGCTIITQELATKKQSFLNGHSDNVSCLACSPSGKYLGSGQVTHMGFKADVIVWLFHEQELYCRLTLHRVKVQAMAFSPSDKYLATLGGRDDNRCLHISLFLLTQLSLSLSGLMQCCYLGSSQEGGSVW